MEWCQNITPGVGPIKWLLLSVACRRDDRLNTAAKTHTFISAQALCPKGGVNQKREQLGVKSSNEAEQNHRTRGLITAGSVFCQD